MCRRVGRRMHRSESRLLCRLKGRLRLGLREGALTRRRRGSDLWIVCYILKECLLLAAVIIRLLVCSHAVERWNSSEMLQVLHHCGSPWPYLRWVKIKNRGRIGGSCGWNSALERRPRVQVPGCGFFSSSRHYLSSCETSNVYTSTHQLADTYWQHTERKTLPPSTSGSRAHAHASCPLRPRFFTQILIRWKTPQKSIHFGLCLYESFEKWVCNPHHS